MSSYSFQPKTKTNGKIFRKILPKHVPLNLNYNGPKSHFFNPQSQGVKKTNEKLDISKSKSPNTSLNLTHQQPIITNRKFLKVSSLSRSSNAGHKSRSLNNTTYNESFNDSILSTKNKSISVRHKCASDRTKKSSSRLSPSPMSRTSYRPGGHQSPFIEINHSKKVIHHHRGRSGGLQTISHSHTTSINTSKVNTISATNQKKKTKLNIFVNGHKKQTAQPSSSKMISPFSKKSLPNFTNKNSSKINKLNTLTKVGSTPNQDRDTTTSSDSGPLYINQRMIKKPNSRVSSATCCSATSINPRVMKKIRCMHDLSKTGMYGEDKKVNQDNYFIFKNFGRSFENIYMGVW